MGRLPTHREVAESLLDIPEVSRFIEERADGCDNCWGDMLLEAQLRFPPRVLASAFRRMVLKGWGECISLTWCPVTSELASEWIRVRNERERLRRTLAGRIKTLLPAYGTVSLRKVRKIWRETRERWKRDVGARSDKDLVFHAISWLEAQGRRRAGRCDI